MPSAADDAVVRAEGLTKVFADFWLRQKAVAVDGISFSIERDEIFGLLGPNGSGKSTTIKMILGLLRRSRGLLSVFGKDPTDVEVKRRIGYLPEETYMYRFLTPQETLDFYGRLFGLGRDVRRRRTAELLEMVGLSHAAHRAVGEFSKGMARRLGIAQSLINDPDLLILDEPTSGLDPLGTRQVKDLLLDLGRRGKTILLSSHQLDDVQDVCDRMVILYGGRIRSEGTVDQLLEDSGRTVITVPHLDARTAERVCSLLESQAGVHVERVASPRQRLEDLFMSIVEAARSDQAQTSGARAGGPTAAFLRGDGAEGEGLIGSLVAADAPVAAADVVAPAPVGADRSVLDALADRGPDGPTEHAAPVGPEVHSGLPSTSAPPSAVAPTPDAAPAPAAAPTPPASPARDSRPARDASVDRSVIDDLLGGGDRP